MSVTRPGGRLCAWALAISFAAGLFLGSTPSRLMAQSDQTSPEVHRFNDRYFGKVAVDFSKILFSPIHWKGKDLVLFGASAGAVGLFFAVDHGVIHWVEHDDSFKSDKLSLYAAKLGEGPFLFSLIGTMYIGGEVFKDDSLRKTALESLESYAICGVIGLGLKVVFGRHRPWTGHQPFDFNFLSIKNHEHSFPSGHSYAAFGVASVIAGESDSFIIGAVSYGLATLVALSRINNNEHWPSDVVFGALLGYFIGKEVLVLNRPSAKNKPKLSLAPAPGGLSLALSF